MINPQTEKIICSFISPKPNITVLRQTCSVVLKLFRDEMFVTLQKSLPLNQIKLFLVFIPADEES